MSRVDRQLIVLVDALGWLTVERTGFLSDLLPFRRRLRTVFGYSSTAVPTLLTGAQPAEHGHWFLYRRAQGGKPFREAGWLDRLPGNLGTRWRIRSRLQEYWRKKHGIKGYFSLYNVPFSTLHELEPIEKEDTWAAGSFPETPTLVDWLGSRSEPFHVSDWRVPDARKVEAALEAIARDVPRVVVLYLTEVDAVQHAVGSDHPDLDRKLETVAADVRRVAARMGEAGPVGISLFSDHGMTDITGHRDLVAELEAAGLRRDRDYRGFFDSTVARFWDVPDRKRLEEALDRVSWGRLLDRATLEAWGCGFGDDSYGELFFLADPGILILPSDMGALPLAGMHGYQPDHPTSDACFLADREVPLAADHLTAVLPALQARVTEGR